MPGARLSFSVLNAFAVLFTLLVLAGQAAADFPSDLPPPPPPPAQAPPEGAPPVNPVQQAETLATWKKIAEKEQAYAGLLAKGDFAAGPALLREIRELRLKTFPADHWMIRTIDVQLAEQEAIAALPDETRETAAKTIVAWKESISRPGGANPADHIARITELSETLTKTLGEGSILALELECHRSQLLLGTQRLGECRPVAADTVTRSAAILGENHPWYAAALSILATTDSNLGRWEDAARESALALRVNERLWGPDAPPCGMNLLALTWAEIHQKRFDAAYRHADRAISILARYQEQDPINYATARRNAAQALMELKRHDEAKEECVKLIEFIDRHPQVPFVHRRGSLALYAELLTRMEIRQDLQDVRKRIADLDASAQTR